MTGAPLILAAALWNSEEYRRAYSLLWGHVEPEGYEPDFATTARVAVHRLRHVFFLAA